MERAWIQILLHSLILGPQCLLAASLPSLRNAREGIFDGGGIPPSEVESIGTRHGLATYTHGRMHSNGDGISQSLRDGQQKEGFYESIVSSVSRPAGVEHYSRDKILRENDPNSRDYQYQALLTPRVPCEPDMTYLLIIVCSAVQNTEQRHAIRATWGSHTSDAKWHTKLLFLTGVPPVVNDTLQKELEKEADLYDDVIQENFVDTYNNLSIKSISMLHYVATYCEKVKYLLKTDDDMFINIPVLMKDLQNSVHTRFIMGHMIAGASPTRDKNSKWFTSDSQFSGTRYPKYLSGCAYVISGDLVKDLYDVTKITQTFWIEDIYVTGICAKKVGAEIVFDSKFGYKPRTMDTCVFKSVITAHRMSAKSLYVIWEQLKEKQRCS